MSPGDDTIRNAVGFLTNAQEQAERVRARLAAMPSTLPDPRLSRRLEEAREELAVAQAAVDAEADVIEVQRQQRAAAEIDLERLESEIIAGQRTLERLGGEAAVAGFKAREVLRAGEAAALEHLERPAKMEARHREA